MKLWHDDIRTPPDETWTWARTNAEAKRLLAENTVEEASLDHDLGLHGEDPHQPDADARIAADLARTEDGYDLVRWMCETGNFPPVVTVHSWNPSGADRMAALLRDHGCRVHVAPFHR